MGTEVTLEKNWKSWDIQIQFKFLFKAHMIELVKDGEEKVYKEIQNKRKKLLTLGVCWYLIGHEGNISRVAAGLPVNKAAKNHKSKISEDQTK